MRTWCKIVPTRRKTHTIWEWVSDRILTKKIIIWRRFALACVSLLGSLCNRASGFQIQCGPSSGLCCYSAVGKSSCYANGSNTKEQAGECWRHVSKGRLKIWQVAEAWKQIDKCNLNCLEVTATRWSSVTLKKCKIASPIRKGLVRKEELAHPQW